MGGIITVGCQKGQYISNGVGYEEKRSEREGQKRETKEDDR